MTLDERGQRAGVELLERARQRPRPSIGVVAAPVPARSRRALVPALAFGVLVFVAAMAFVLTRDDSAPAPVVDMPVPAGVEPTSFAPDGLGASMQVPATWIGRPGASGWRFIVHDPRDDGGVVATRMTSVADVSASEFGAARRASLERTVEGFEVISVDEVTVGDGEAFVIEYRFETGRVFTEYDVRVAPRQFAVISINAVVPNGTDLRAWIGSTIAVEPSTLQDLERPVDVADGVLPPPERIEATTTFAPEGVGVSMKVPERWETGARLGDLEVMRDPDDGVFVHAGRRQAPPAGGHVLASTETTIDGRPAAVTRLLNDSFTPGIGALITLISIDMGDGTFIVVELGEINGPQDELLDWIRSTIQVSG